MERESGTRSRLSGRTKQVAAAAATSIGSVLYPPAQRSQACIYTISQGCVFLKTACGNQRGATGLLEEQEACLFIVPSQTWRAGPSSSKRLSTGLGARPDHPLSA